MEKLPDGWTGYVGGIATSLHPISGGIIDQNCDGWFVIPENDCIREADGFKTQQEAFDYLAKEAANLPTIKGN